MSDPMYPPPPPPGMAPPPMGPVGSANAAAQVAGPATGLMIAAVVGIIWALISLCMHFLGMGMGALNNLNGGAGERFGRFLGGGLGLVANIIGLAIGGFIIWASMQMKQLRGWTLSVIAAVVAMIPCISPCCLVGLPVGIWALIVLMKPEVKSSFVG
jgi:hypothetical protein